MDGGCRVAAGRQVRKLLQCPEVYSGCFDLRGSSRDDEVMGIWIYLVAKPRVLARQGEELKRSSRSEA